MGAAKFTILVGSDYLTKLDALRTSQGLPLRLIGSAIGGRLIFRTFDSTLVASHNFVHNYSKEADVDLCGKYIVIHGLYIGI